MERIRVRKNLNAELSVEEQQILDHENDLKAAEISTEINMLMDQLDKKKASLMELESKSKTADITELDKT